MITNEVIIDSIATGQNIKKLMKLHNHSVAHLSKLSGLSPTTITNYRSGYNVPKLHKPEIYLGKNGRTKNYYISQKLQQCHKKIPSYYVGEWDKKNNFWLGYLSTTNPNSSKKNIKK